MKLEVKNLHLNYGALKVLNGIDLKLKSGRIQALIGPNGAGKSSTMRVLSGLSIPSKGEALIDGKLLSHVHELRKYCGFFIESPQFHGYLTGLENLKLFIQLSDSKVQAEDLLNKVGLRPHQNKKFRQYSRGMKQRLGMAQSLIGKPNFLILDEPFHGLDPEVKGGFIEMFRRIADSGTGILITSHLLKEVESIADDFILLKDGEVYLDGKMSDYNGEKQHVTFYFDRAIDSTKWKIKSENDKHFMDSMLTREETEELLKELVSNDLTPYKLERSSILYDKYMEITS